MIKPKTTLHRGLQRAGFSLIESSFAVLLTGLLMVAALRSVGASKRREAGTNNQVRAQQLAADLMNEILRQAYQEPVSPPVFGPEAGESTGNRTLFDDVDDYRTWTSTPPNDRSGAAVPGFSGWTRSAAVIWADPTTFGTTAQSNTGLKKITVTVSNAGKIVASVVGYRSSAWIHTIPSPTDNLGNHSPTAVATVTPASGNASVTRTFIGSTSSDQDSDPLTYAWNFGDGTAGNGDTISHRYGAAGNYTCTLTVYDGRGGSGTASLTVTVAP